MVDKLASNPCSADCIELTFPLGFAIVSFNGMIKTFFSLISSPLINSHPTNLTRFVVVRRCGGIDLVDLRFFSNFSCHGNQESSPPPIFLATRSVNTKAINKESDSNRF